MRSLWMMVLAVSFVAWGKTAAAQCTLDQVLQYAGADVSMIVRIDVRAAASSETTRVPGDVLAEQARTLRAVHNPALQGQLQELVSRVYTFRSPGGQLVAGELRAPLSPTAAQNINAIPQARVLSESATCHLFLYSESPSLLAQAAQRPGGVPSWLASTRHLEHAPNWTAVRMTDDQRRRIVTLAPQVPIQARVADLTAIEASMEGATARVRFVCPLSEQGRENCNTLAALAKIAALYRSPQAQVTSTANLVEFGGVSADHVVDFLAHFR